MSDTPWQLHRPGLFNQIEFDCLIKLLSDSKESDHLVGTISILMAFLNIEFDQKWLIVLENGQIR